MKTKCILIGLVIGILSSCSKYETDILYKEELSSVNHESTLVSTNEHSQKESELFGLINKYRDSIGLPILEFDFTTYYYAGEHTSYMISKGVLSHDNFNDRAANISKRTGAELVAENVSRNYDTMQEILDGWINSPNHRVNLEGNYNYSALSIRPNADGKLYITQMFYK